MGIEYFDYLLSSAGENSLEQAYPSIDSLGERFLVRKECGGFNLFDNLTHFLSVLDNTPESERMYHEIILNTSQKLKFDVDAKLPDLLRLAGHDATIEDVPDCYRCAFSAICRAIKEQMYICWGIKDAQLLVCVNAPPPGYAVEKYSNHIIVPGYYVSGAEQAREFTSRVLSILEPGLESLLDLGVNSNTQNFRCVGCRKKKGIPRVKNILGGWPREAAFIRNIENCERLPDLVSGNDPRRFPAGQSADNAQGFLAEIPRYLDVCRKAGLLEHFTYRNARNGFIYFDRAAPSHCRMCSRVHPCDNSLYVQVGIYPGKTILRAGCRNFDSDKANKGRPFSDRSWVIGELTNDVPESDTPAMRKIDRMLANALAEDIPEEKYFPQDHPYCAAAEWNIYSEDKLRPFELAETLVVQAAMKMGKTKTLKAFIDKHYPGVSPGTAPGGTSTDNPVVGPAIAEASVCIVSFRQTFTGATSATFPDFTVYSEVSGPLTQRRIIVQFESLHKIAIPAGTQPFDLLVCDESESIIDQMGSGLSKQFGECLRVFKWLIGYSRQVICMDANITTRTLTVLQYMRPTAQASAANAGNPRGLSSGPTIHWNRYQNATDDRWYYYTEVGAWLCGLREYLTRGRRVVIPTSSLTEARGIMCGLRGQFPQLKVYLYSSETSPGEKRDHFSDVNKFWAEYDVLIYTPTVSAGVSFEVVHYDAIFAYFSDMSCPAETCIQMIGRIRDVGLKEYHVFVTALGANLPVSIEDIREDLLHSRKTLCGDDTPQNYTGLEVEYDQNGRGVIAYTSSYFYAWAENKIARNRTKNNLCRALTGIVRKSGARQLAVTAEIFEELYGIALYVDDDINPMIAAAEEDYRDARSAARDKKATEIAEAQDIDELTAACYQERMLAQQDMTPAEIREYDKYKLRHTYNFRGDIGPDFVLTYDKLENRRAYKNLCRIAGYPTTEDALEAIREQEKSAYFRACSYGVDSEYVDLHRRYTYCAHLNAHKILTILGWQHLRDRSQQHTVVLCDRVSRNAEEFWRAIHDSCVGLDVYAPKQVFGDGPEVAGKIVKAANRVLRGMYCCKIRKLRNSSDTYELVWPDNIFDTSPEMALARGVPLVANYDLA